MVKFVPTRKDITAEQAAQLYVDNVWSQWGLSESIVMDRDSKFTSAFFKEVFDRLGTKLNMSVAGRPQLDGLSERMNRVLKEMLRSFVNHHQDDWPRYLPLCEFACHSAVNSSTKASPFSIVYGFEPRSPSDFVSGGGTVSDWIQDRTMALQQAKDARSSRQHRRSTSLVCG